MQAITRMYKVYTEPFSFIGQPLTFRLSAKVSKTPFNLKKNTQPSIYPKINIYPHGNLKLIKPNEVARPHKSLTVVKYTPM